MASLTGIEYMETTLPSIMALINSQRMPYPTMAEYIWNENIGPEERRLSDEERKTICLNEIIYEGNTCL